MPAKLTNANHIAPFEVRKPIQIEVVNKKQIIYCPIFNGINWSLTIKVFAIDHSEMQFYINFTTFSDSVHFQSWKVDITNAKIKESKNFDLS